MLYNYSFANRKRDLSDVMATVIKDEPRFISNFRTAPDAASAKHEYLEDLLTGRSVSADEVGSSTVRMIPCCIAFGQAAGTAAAQAIRTGKNPADIDVQALRASLREQNVFLGEE